MDFIDMHMYICILKILYNPHNIKYEIIETKTNFSQQGWWIQETTKIKLESRQ